jgi:UDP-N-acetylglucosamine acyltransferase
VDIHPCAAVDPSARLGRDVSVGPFCVIEAGAAIGDRCRLAAGVVVKKNVIVGDDNVMFEGAILGGMPQHAHMPERPGGVVIGRGNVIREHVTIHRALAEGVDTIVGDGNLLMAGAHVAHDCRLGNRIIVANNVLLAGHVTVDDRAYISGAVAVHQFCRIGSLAMVGGQAHVVKDVPPFVTVDGLSSCVVGLNHVGLRRNGFSAAEVRQLKQAYRLVYRSGLPWSTILERLPVEFPSGPAATLYAFLCGGTRGFIPARAAPAHVTLRLRDEDYEEALEQQAKAG